MEEVAMNLRPTYRSLQPKTNPVITSLLFAIAMTALFTYVDCRTNKSPDVLIVETLQLGTETPRIY